MNKLQIEVDAGLAEFRKIVESGNRIRVLDARPSPNRFLVHFVLGTGDEKQTSLYLSYEFLSDFPAMKDYKTRAQEFISDLEKRSEGPSLNEFYSRSGTPMSVEIDWPLTPIAERDASFVHARVKDLRNTKLIAKCVMIFVNSPFERWSPFSRDELIVNRVRAGVDREEVLFYAEAAHPYESQRLEIWSSQIQMVPATNTELEQFVSGKTFWLAFKRGDKSTKIWIADSWDARYLGVDQKTLLQAAQIQQARGIISVDSKALASAGSGLLLGKPGESKQKTLLFISADANSEKAVRTVLKDILPKSVALLDVGTEQSGRSLVETVRAQIERADFVLLDVTGNNPNVLLNLGYAQALRKQMAALVAKNASKDLPTDLSGFLYLPYDLNNPADLKRTLGSYLQRYWALDARV